MVIVIVWYNDIAVILELLEDHSNNNTYST